MLALEFFSLGYRADIYTNSSSRVDDFSHHNTVYYSHRMELFGVQELPSTKSISAPGWAYVPDTGINPSVAALQPSRAKRARNLPSTSAHENTAKQDAKILRELAALDKESHKDVQIPVPVKHRDNAGRGIIP
jgi:zinc finger HIT domain-containing protein 1